MCNGTVFTSAIFDAGTHLLLVEDYDLPSKSYQYTYTLKNYQAIDGILFPMRSVEISDLSETITE